MAEDVQALEAATRLEEKRAERLKAWQSIVLLLLLGGIPEKRRALEVLTALVLNPPQHSRGLF